MKIILTYIILCLSVGSLAQSAINAGKTRIEILSADELHYNQDVGRYQTCKGNVRFRQDEMLMDCDSARFYEEVNKIEAFGHIYIRQKDTVDLWGDYLEYDGDTKMAVVSKKVKLSDGTMTLTTERLNYDMQNNIGYYTTGGNIVNGQDKLYSMKGTYYSKSKEFYFKDSVKLTNPEYIMTSDTLRYNTRSKIATFLGPTNIRSEENTIYCQYGWYNTKENISQFSKGSYIEGKENKLMADSMVYYRNSGLGEAYGNILFIDTLEDVTITGQYGRYDRLTKTTLITGAPIAIKNIDGDSFYIKSDTLIDVTDTLIGRDDTLSSLVRKLNAYHNVTVFKSDIQAVSDSMVYNFSDSTIRFYYNPVLWADNSQITGDTIVVYRNEKGLEKLEAYKDGFIIDQDRNGLFNQIKGKRLDAYFVSGKIKKVDVNGNGQSIYYALEDSTQYSGVNDVVCGNMTILIDSNTKVRTITFYNKPKAKFYPLEKFPSSKSRLPGFSWKSAERPRKAYFIEK